MTDRDQIIVNALAAILTGKAYVESASVNMNEGFRKHVGLGGDLRTPYAYDYEIRVRSSRSMSFEESKEDSDTVSAYFLGRYAVNQNLVVKIIKLILKLPEEIEDEAVFERAAIFFGEKLKKAEGK